MPDPQLQPQVRLDAQSLRGLAHPLRLRLLGLLRLDGPATASGLAAVVGESSGVTSYHLRQLAGYGFIVPDDAPHASKKERWWKAAHRTTVLEPIPDADPETRMLVDEYLRSVAGAHADRLLRSADSAADTRQQLGAAWAEVFDLSDWMLEITASQAEEIDRTIHKVLSAYPQSRPGESPREGTQRVALQIQLMPTMTADVGTS